MGETGYSMTIDEFSIEDVIETDYVSYERLSADGEINILRKDIIKEYHKNLDVNVLINFINECLELQDEYIPEDKEVLLNATPEIFESTIYCKFNVTGNRYLNAENSNENDEFGEYQEFENDNEPEVLGELR